MTARRDEQRAAPPDDGHAGSFTKPSDVMEVGAAPPDPGVRPGSPSLHTDVTYAPQRTAWRGVLFGLVLTALLAVLVLFTWTSAR